MDLMIHDLELILSLVDASPLRFDALGVSVMGQHEDAADVRVTFADGCGFAHLTASRVSYSAARICRSGARSRWSPSTLRTLRRRSSAPAIRCLTTCPIQRRSVSSRNSRRRTSCLSNTCRLRKCVLRRDALVDELEDFAACIETGRQPRVTGAAGLKAVACCEAILQNIDEHAWDGHPEGRFGPLAAFQPITIRPPHWHADAAEKHRDG